MTIDKAENAIQSTLINLVNSTGRDIELVRIDTRNFANIKVEIILKPGATWITEEAAQ
jgi:hypothetical protein